MTVLCSSIGKSNRARHCRGDWYDSDVLRRGSILKGLMADAAAYKRFLRKLNRIEQLGTQVCKGQG